MEKENLISMIRQGGITHPSVFHADDVLATCLIRLIDKKFSVKRTNDVPDGFKGVIYDIGWGRYDHHQKNAESRANGIKYAAFGLLWRDLWSEFMDEEHAQLFDAIFVSEIDRCDNSSDTNLLSSSIEAFNPPWNSDDEEDTRFEEAVRTFTPVLKNIIKYYACHNFIPRYVGSIECEINQALKNICHEKGVNIDIDLYEKPEENYYSCCIGILENEETQLFVNSFLSKVNNGYGKFKTSPFIISMYCIRKELRTKTLQAIMTHRLEKINALVPAQAECEKFYQAAKDKNIIIFDRYIPMTSMTSKHLNIKFIIYPSGREGYNILCADMCEKEKTELSIPKNKNVKRIYFPEDLRGKDETFLLAYSDGLKFVHPAGFIASCDSEKNAIIFAKKVLNTV